MKPHLTSPILIPAVALLLLAVIAVGYQVASPQPSQCRSTTDEPAAAATAGRMIAYPPGDLMREMHERLARTPYHV